MGLSKEQLSSIISKNAQTMRESSQKKSTRTAGGYAAMGDATINAYDRMVFGDDYEDEGGYGNMGPDDKANLWEERNREMQKALSEKAYKNSNLPDNIKNAVINSMNEEQSLATNSVSDPERIRKIMQMTDRTPKENKPVVNNGGGAGVDYSVIKAIVSECIKEYFEQKMPLNEGSLSQILIKSGVISLVDNKGNVYQANLKKIGNKNDVSE